MLTVYFPLAASVPIWFSSMSIYALDRFENFLTKCFGRLGFRGHLAVFPPKSFLDQEANPKHTASPALILQTSQQAAYRQLMEQSQVEEESFTSPP